MQFRILGPLQVLEQGRPLPLGGTKPRSALAMLLLGRNRVVSRNQLIDGLWGESPPPSAGPTLETYVSRLRRVLDGDGQSDRLMTQPPGYRLRVEPGELDLERFETLLSHAREAGASGDPGTAADELREALSLFRGAPLEDLAHAPFAEVEIARLDELRLDALEERLDADLAVGRHAEVVGELESLVARHPFREALWGQLMLALYRCGRQGEALSAFDRVRRTLDEELGVYPGQTLKQLHQQILQQDPALEPEAASVGSAGIATPQPGGLTRRPDEPPSEPAPPPPPEVTEPSAAPARGGGRPRRRAFGPRRRALAIGTALPVVLALAAILVPRLLAGGEASATYRPGTALIDLSTGKEIRFIPPSELSNDAYAIFAGGHFWVVSFEPLGYVEIDADDGNILKRLNLPPRDPTVHEDFSTATPWAVEGNRLWVISGDDLVELNPRLVDGGLGREVNRFKLDHLGRGSGLAEGVAVGGGSVWVSRDVGRGQILRLDPATGRPEHVWNDVTPYLNLAYGDGSLWAGDESGLVRIDSETNRVTHVNGIRGNCAGSEDGGCVRAGGGFGWTTVSQKGAVYKVDDAGQIAATYDNTGISSGYMAYADGVLWVRNHDDGTVTGIDAVTGRITATYRFGHPVDDIAAGDGVLLVDVTPGPTLQDRIDALGRNVARMFADPHELAEEPAISLDPSAYRIEFATCAKLLNYPDEPPPQGLRLRPEVAAAMPTISSDGRTYTFKVRPGYRFSPPSNQSVTAATFRHSIERALSPRLAANPTGVNPPGPRIIDDIEGEHAFREGAARHISGLRARGDTLSITLTRPSPDFLERLALPFFCPVPRGTSTVAGAPRGVRGNGHEFIPSAGPYYVANTEAGDGAILKRNPNYHGPRPHALDAVAIREGADASAALESVNTQGWDGIISVSDPLLDPGGAVDRQWGAESAAAPSGDRRYYTTPQARTRFIAFNSGRGDFADPRVRRAAAMALDRSALAAARKDLPTDQLLSPALPGYQERDLYRLNASVSKARALLDGHGGRATMPIPSGCDRCADVAHVVATDFAAIGIHVEVRQLDHFKAALQAGTRFDLLDASTGIPYPDSASFLQQMMRDVPAGWASAKAREEVRRVASLSGDRRQRAAEALADRLATGDVSVAAYGIPQTSQFVGPGAGCRVFTPAGYGLDLAALCLDSSSG